MKTSTPSRPKFPVTAVLFAAILCCAASPAFSASSFRGFTVSDTPTQLEATAKSEGYTVKWGKPFRLFDDEATEATIYDGDNACAWITYNGDKKIESMRFDACFFDAEGLGIQQVTQEFVKKFGGQAEMDSMLDPACKDAKPFAYKGRTAEGEIFRIEEQCGGVGVEIKPGSGKHLRF